MQYNENTLPMSKIRTDTLETERRIYQCTDSNHICTEHVTSPSPKTQNFQKQKLEKTCSNWFE